MAKKLTIRKSGNIYADSVYIGKIEYDDLDKDYYYLQLPEAVVGAGTLCAIASEMIKRRNEKSSPDASLSSPEVKGSRGSEGE